MFDKLEAVEKRYEEVAVQLANPEVIARRQEFQKLSKEHADLSDLVTAYRDYKRVVGDLDANKPLLEEKDAEMRAMAREEQHRLDADKTRLEESLKLLLLPKDPNDDKNIVLEIRVALLDGFELVEHGRNCAGRRRLLLLAPVLVLEALDAAGGVEQLLLARVERMAGRADVDREVAARRRHLIGVPARACHLRGAIGGVNTSFCHDPSPPKSGLFNPGLGGNQGVRRALSSVGLALA